MSFRTLQKQCRRVFTRNGDVTPAFFGGFLFCRSLPSRPSVERGVDAQSVNNASKHVTLPIPLPRPRLPSSPIPANTLVLARGACFAAPYTWCCRQCGVLRGACDAFDFAQKVHARELGSKPQPEPGQSPPPARRRQDVQGVRRAPTHVFFFPAAVSLATAGC